jgi:diguanylate cyclase (GGDEF)-like protein/PAS domain S-box-containing protein
MSEVDAAIAGNRQHEGLLESPDPAHWHGLFDALRQRERRTRLLHDEQPLLVLVIEPDTNVVESVNAYGARLLDWQARDLVGLSVETLAPPDGASRLRAELRECVQQSGHVHRFETCLLRKDGRLLWLRAGARAVMNADERQVILLCCEDVSEARLRSRTLAYRARHDPVTGLINRAEFERRLQRALYDAGSHSSEHALALLDVDQFKVINYRFGHAAGDELLHEIGEIVTDALRSGDTVARLNGDELGILLEHCSMTRAHALVAEVVTAIGAYDFEWAGQPYNVTASVGLVPIRPDSDSVAELLSHADAACRAAADGGRGRIHVWRADDREVGERQREMEWAARVENALHAERFRLHMQPIVPLRAGTGIYYELLLRMEDEKGGLISAQNFLPAAERFHLGPRLDRWVVGRAIDWLNARGLASAEDTCCINLSGQSLADPEFPRFVLDRLMRRRSVGASICFEITETSLIANLERARASMETLAHAGCRFALDDFGSGHSSFAYLKSLPVQWLKIDGSFVRGIAESDEDLAFLRLINELGHLTGKRTVAESVESEPVLQKLREIGVDFAQGYHMGRPGPIEERVAANESGEVPILKLCEGVTSVREIAGR